MKVQIWNGTWQPSDAQKNPNCMFVFGDNDVKKGLGGSAIIRDEDNAFGIPTKKYPNNFSSSFYDDSELGINKANIDRAIERILSYAEDYSVIYFPKGGIGSGFAKLEEKAPLTYAYLLEQLEKHFGI